jgi:hypothetical protein
MDMFIEVTRVEKEREYPITLNAEHILYVLETEHVADAPEAAHSVVLLSFLLKDEHEKIFLKQPYSDVRRMLDA